MFQNTQCGWANKGPKRNSSILIMRGLNMFLTFLEPFCCALLVGSPSCIRCTVLIQIEQCSICYGYTLCSMNIACNRKWSFGTCKQRGCGLSYGKHFIRDTASFYCKSMNCNSQFSESQWKYGVSCMKIPAVRKSATSKKTQTSVFLGDLW